MTELAERAFWPSVWNGMNCRCPRCGKGWLFRGYIKVRDACDQCGLDYSRHRADDLPAYIAITIVGHILVVGLMHFEMGSEPVAPWVYMAWLVPLAIILPLAMLPPIKGAIVGLQWAKRMHGF